MNGTTYVLAQVILYNGSHFQGITIVEGKFLFYDGIGRGNRLKWIPFDYEWGARYQPQILWYKNSERGDQEREWGQEAESDQRNNSSTNTGKKSRKKRSGTERALEEYYSTKEDDGTDTGKQDKGKEATTNKGKESADKKKKKTSTKKGTKTSTSQMGISVKQVSSRGKQPNCQYCRQDIARGEWHTVNICENQSNCGNKIWKRQIHYMICVVFIR